MASNTVGRYALLLTGDTAGINKAFTDVDSGAQQLEASLNRIGTRLLGALSVAAITAFINRTREQIDELGKLSSALQVPVATLQGYQLAARRAGVATETFNEGIQRLLVRVGEASQGRGEALNIFSQLGLDPTQLAELNTNELLRTVADRIGSIDNRAQQAAIGNKLFEESWRSLQRILADGSGALDEADDALARFGGGLGDAEVARVEALNDSITDLQAGFQLLQQRILIDLLPALETLLSITNALVNGWRELQEVFADAAVTYVRLFNVFTGGQDLLGDVSVAELLAPTSAEVQAANDRFQGAAVNFDRNADNLQKLIDRYNRQFASGQDQLSRNIGQAIEALTGGLDIDVARRASESFIERFLGEASDFEDLLSRAQQVQNVLEDITATAPEASRAFLTELRFESLNEILGESAQKFREAADLIARSTPALQRAQDSLENQLRQLQVQFQLGLIDETAFRRATRQGAEDFRDAILAARREPIRSLAELGIDQFILGTEAQGNAQIVANEAASRQVELLREQNRIFDRVEVILQGIRRELGVGDNIDLNIREVTLN